MVDDQCASHFTLSSVVASKSVELEPNKNTGHINRLWCLNNSSPSLLLARPAAATQGELPDSGYRQGKKTLPQSDEDGGCGGDVVRV